MEAHNTMHAELSFHQGMEFQCTNRGILSTIDASLDHGGKDLGPTPKELILNGMMGCTAMDVVALMNKMRQQMTSFNMKIDVEKNEEHPIYFKKATLHFFLTGTIEADKLIKAVDLSLTKYCGVNYMISKTCHITYTVHLNEALIHEGVTNFIDPLK
jgi:putative redox protein